MSLVHLAIFYYYAFMSFFVIYITLILVIFYILMNIFNNKNILHYTGDKYMNELQKSLNLNHINNIDLEIYMRIDAELLKLEDIARLKQYKEQIHSRRVGIKFFFKDFEYNNCILKSKSRFGFSNTLFNVSDIYEKSLDDIIFNKINYIISKMFYEVSKNITNNKTIQEKLNKIIDRKLGVKTLFDNFSENINFLTKYKGISQNTFQI